MEDVEIYMNGDNVVVENERIEDEEVDSSDDDEAELSWRLNPEKSLSDWILQIVTKGNNMPVDTYHVHKSVLAVGPRRSNFFAQAFRPKSQQQSPRSTVVDDDTATSVDQLTAAGPSFTISVDAVSHTSRLVLEDKAAEAIPVILDYIYTGNLAICTENACALHYLSQQFEIKALRRQVKDFWINAINMDNLTKYYQDARVFKDERILAHAEEYCAQHIFDVDENRVVEILTTLDPYFFLRVVSSERLQKDNGTSYRLSLLVAVYCNIHKSELNESLFLRLTAASHIPKLEVKAAMVLIELEGDICGDSSNVTSLKERAIDVLSEHWDEACVTGDEQVDLPKLTGDALSIFVKESFLNAHIRLVSVNALQRKNRELQTLIEKQTDLEADLQATEEELVKARREKDEEHALAQTEILRLMEENKLLQQSLEDARRDLVFYKDQEKLRRVAAKANNNESPKS